MPVVAVYKPRGKSFFFMRLVILYDTSSLHIKYRLVMPLLVIHQIKVTIPGTSMPRFGSRRHVRLFRYEGHSTNLQVSGRPRLSLAPSLAEHFMVH